MSSRHFDAYDLENGDSSTWEAVEAGIGITEFEEVLLDQWHGNANLTLSSRLVLWGKNFLTRGSVFVGFFVWGVGEGGIEL